MKFILPAIALYLAHTGLYAQDAAVSTQDSAPPAGASPFSIVLGLGLSAGGDTLATATFGDGSSQTIKGGRLFYFKGGVDWRISPGMSLQGTVGYHGDSITGSNGSVKFGRTFVEALAFWDTTPLQRVGVGLRQITSAKLTSDGAASGIGNVDFTASLGAVVEYEWAFSRHGNRANAIAVRYVSQKYTPNKLNGQPVTGPDLDGSHLGLGLNFYF